MKKSFAIKVEYDRNIVEIFELFLCNKRHYFLLYFLIRLQITVGVKIKVKQESENIKKKKTLEDFCCNCNELLK